jgi:hypothetical protein
LPGIDLGHGYCLDGCLFLSHKGLDPGALLVLQSLPFRTARIARFTKGDALGLSVGV